MNNSKLNIMTDYETFDIELKTELKLAHPGGFSNAIIEFTNNKKKKVSAIRWETPDKIYLLRLSNKKLIQLMEEEAELENDY